MPSSPAHFALVAFARERPYEVSDLQWFRVSDADVAHLVGAGVDRDRGQGYRPWPREPDPQPVYQLAWVGLLPRPKGMNRGCLRSTGPWWQRLGRQAIPRCRSQGCCYYHEIECIWCPQRPAT